MPAELHRYNEVASFLDRVEDFLLLHEVENNLPLGLLSALAVNPTLYGDPPYLALVEDGMRVSGVALMTPPLNLIVAAEPATPLIDLLVRDAYGFRPHTPGVLAQSDTALAVATVWKELNGTHYRKLRAERIYKLERVLPSPVVPGRARRLGDRDGDLFMAWMHAFQVDTEQTQDDDARLGRMFSMLLDAPSDLRGAFVWEDPEPVCYVGYGRPTRHGMSIAPVYTPPEKRRRGYATALTAFVTQHLLEAGRDFCTLFTDLANPTSNKIYQSIGYEPVCDFDEYAFELPLQGSATTA